MRKSVIPIGAGKFKISCLLSSSTDHLALICLNSINISFSKVNWSLLKSISFDSFAHFLGFPSGIKLSSSDNMSDMIFPFLSVTKTKCIFYYMLCKIFEPAFELIIFYSFLIPFSLCSQT